MLINCGVIISYNECITRVENLYDIFYWISLSSIATKYTAVRLDMITVKGNFVRDLRLSYLNIPSDFSIDL